LLKAVVAVAAQTETCARASVVSNAWPKRTGRGST
jgi:hypothetical protein